jgi:hypothetical protein
MGCSSGYSSYDAHDWQRDRASEGAPLWFPKS